MAKIILFCLLSTLALASAQRITTIHLDGVQYFISRMNPYSPELNYFLAYQYCRSLGLQLASFETKEKAESMTTYLKNAGYGNYDFWTSGNRLGTGMFLWMSTGLPFNATFDFFENSADAIQAGLLDPVDHNSNTSPQRTARDSSSGAEKGCVILKQPTLKWMPEDCSVVKDFICEQTRCYYYNYGSIPVSSAQGRPITSTTPRMSTAGFMNFHTTSTTPLPLLMSAYAKKKAAAQADIPQQPSFASLKLDHERALDSSAEDETETQEENNDNPINMEEEDLSAVQSIDDQDDIEEENARELKDHLDSLAVNDLHQDESENHKDIAATDDNFDKAAVKVSTSLHDDEPSNMKLDIAKSSEKTQTSPPEIPAVEVRLKQISQEVEKMANSNESQQHPSIMSNNHVNDDVGRQSFLSLTDLIRTLRPSDKQIIPQIDSDYSNAMRVLGENSASIVNKDDNRQQPTRGFF